MVNHTVVKISDVDHFFFFFGSCEIHIVNVLFNTVAPHIQKLLIAKNTKDNAHDDKHKGCSTTIYAFM